MKLSACENLKRTKILQWLSRSNAAAIHQVEYTKHQEGTGSWFLSGQKYRGWKESASSCLCLYGKSGSGKSVLLSQAIQELGGVCDITQYHGHSNTLPHGVCFFYYSDRESSQTQTLECVISTMISHLSAALPQIPSNVATLYERAQEEEFLKRDVSLKELSDIFQSVLRNFQDVFIAIDALDEIPSESGGPKALFSFLRQLSSWAPSRIHLLLTTQHIPEMHSFNDQASWNISTILMDPESDISTYIEARLIHDEELAAWDDDTKKQMEQTLASHADGSFQWAYLQLLELKECITRKQVRETLERLPKTLEQTYERILSKIPRSCSQVISAVLQWLACSRRTLSIEELEVAAMIDPSSNQTYDPTDKIRPGSLLKHLSRLLTTKIVDIDWRGVSESGVQIVQLSHSSIRQFLLQTTSKNARSPSFEFSEIAAHKFIAKSCIIYQRYYEKNWSSMSNSDREALLMPYVDAEWFNHAREAEGSGVAFDNLVVDFVLSEIAHIPFEFRAISRLNQSLGCLYFACTTGLLSVVTHLLKSEPIVNASVFDLFNPATAFAMSNCFSGIVNEFIKSAAVSNAFGACTEAPPPESFELYAAMSQSLLDYARGVEPAGFSESALLYAIQQKREVIMEILVTHQISKKREVAGMSEVDLLRFVANFGLRNENVMPLMSHSGRPLHVAAINGHFEIVKLLVTHGADPNAQDYLGNTPAENAYDASHEEIGEYLISHGGKTRHACPMDDFQQILDQCMEVASP